LIGALSLGYGAHSLRDRQAGAGTPTPVAILPHAGVATPIAASTVARRDTPAPRHPAGHPVREVEVGTLSDPPTAPVGGVWRTESYERAIAAGLSVPRVAGLPVIQIQVQEASSPLVAVDQQLTSGQTVRTIEGPANEIAALDRSAVASTGPTGLGTSSVRMQSGNRMLLMTARIPPDSLRALLARLKTK
ncbi:MAG TPA: hypothetical protein VFI13_12700, partial [Gemmatimonadales bacterium]|nr:hypothetical protein [Gemmatimonadales bacterium]